MELYLWTLCNTWHVCWIMYHLGCMLVEARPFMVLDELSSLYGLKYNSVTACGLPLYLCSYKLYDSATASMSASLRECIPQLWGCSHSLLHPWLETIFLINGLASVTLSKKMLLLWQHLNGSYPMELSHGRSFGSKASLPYHGVGMWRHTLAFIPRLQKLTHQLAVES